jgi:tRNA 2-selenouridine synthase
MALTRVAAADVLPALISGSAYSAVIDARSESEFAEDHLPGAVNWPTLTDAQRADVGTQYKQISAFDARKRGAALAAHNIAQHVLAHVQPLPQTWRPLVYCWRGGQRSGALATVLAAIGFNVAVLEGGYRDFRRAVVAELETLPLGLRLRVLCGRTGSAKSRLLQALQAQGAQVLDLEQLACHRGSVLGLEPGLAQPSQKAFETAVWHTLSSFDASREVFVESESRTIGRCRLPDALLQHMRAAPCVQVQLPLPERVNFLMHDYSHFVADVPSFSARLSALREVRGDATVQAWQDQLAAQGSAALPAVVMDLLTLHYDPVYLKSMQRNYSGYASATELQLPDASPPSLHAAVQQLLPSA